MPGNAVSRALTTRRIDGTIETSRSTRITRRARNTVNAPLAGINAIPTLEASADRGVPVLAQPAPEGDVRIGAQPEGRTHQPQPQRSLVVHALVEAQARGVVVHRALILARIEAQGGGRRADRWRS